MGRIIPGDCLMNRKQLLYDLGISETEIITSQKAEIITEKLFCAAILSQGTDVAQKVLERYTELRGILERGI